MAVEYRRHPQHPLELRVLRDWVKDANSICEIGSRFGDNLIFLAVSMNGNRLVSVDFPGAEGEFPDYAPEQIKAELKNNVRKLKKSGFDVDLILGDSHSFEVLEQVEKFGPFDVMLIDGDHSYEGVKADWEMYGPLAKQVIFHDVKSGNGLGVSQFWSRLWGLTPDIYEDYVADGSNMGIGRVIKK
jgi:cephalosporin hydroxylase